MSSKYVGMFIRFGAPPEGGRSWNDEEERWEAGVSVYPAEWMSSDQDLVCVQVPSDECIGTIRGVQDRPVYICEGDLLDEVGGDGEPLLANCKAYYHGPVEDVSYVVVAE